jgi:glycine cleavage system H lipoate-binding protein
VNSQGYAGILSIERNANLAQLRPAELMTAAPQRTASLPLILGTILILGIAVGIGLRAFMRTATPKEEVLAGAYAHPHKSLDEKAIQVPEGLYYDNSHTWAFREKNGWVSVGLDDFMQHLVGPITKIQMKNAGDSVKKGEVLFTLSQSGKQLSIYSPLSGTIRKHNEMLSGNPATVNTSPYSEGWVYQIEPSHWLKEMPLLKAAEKFRSSLSGEFSRVKDVLAASLKPNTLELAYVNLQDGGELKDGVLADLSPEVWADFQSHFLDQHK